MTMTRMDVPIGTVLDFAGANVPAGYLECDGSAVSRAAYPKLFAAIGTAWGAGNGSTTFNLPNLGGRTCIGKGSRAVGNTGGSETHTLTTSELPSHKHSVGAHKHTVPEHGHTYTRPTISSSGKVTGGITGGSHSHSMQGYYWGTPGGSVAFRSRNKISGDAQDSDSAIIASTHTHDLPNHTHTLTGGSVANKAAFDTNNSTAFDSGAAGGVRLTASCSPTPSCGRSYAPPSEAVVA